MTIFWELNVTDPTVRRNARGELFAVIHDVSLLVEIDTPSATFDNVHLSADKVDKIR